MQDNSEENVRTVAQSQLIFSKRHTTRGSADKQQLSILSESSTSFLHVKNHVTTEWRGLGNIL